MAELAKHRVQCRNNVTAVRERIERVLNLTTTARMEGDVWAIYFDAPKEVDLDFLRPDVLPPREGQMTSVPSRGIIGSEARMGRTIEGISVLRLVQMGIEKGVIPAVIPDWSAFLLLLEPDWFVSHLMINQELLNDMENTPQITEMITESILRTRKVYREEAGKL